MKVFFAKLKQILDDHFYDVEVVDVGKTKHKDSTLNQTIEGFQGVYRIDQDQNDTSYREIEAYGHGPLYFKVESLMRQFPQIDSFEVTTRQDMIIVAVYNKPWNKSANSIPTVDDVLTKLKWMRGRMFPSLQEGLKELAGDLLRASRTVPYVKSYQPDEGRSDIRLKSLHGSNPMEIIRLAWERSGSNKILLKVEIARGW